MKESFFLSIFTMGLIVFSFCIIFLFTGRKKVKNVVSVTKQLSTEDLLKNIEEFYFKFLNKLKNKEDITEMSSLIPISVEIPLFIISKSIEKLQDNWLEVKLIARAANADVIIDRWGFSFINGKLKLEKILGAS